MKASGGRHDGGFTLVEMLIVVVILGILATATVFAVTGIANKGKTSACLADHRTLVGAEEAYTAENAEYGTMAELVSGGRLRSTSTLFTVTVNPAGDAYTITGVGECAGFVPPGGASAAAPSGGAAGSTTGVADTITFAGMSALSYAAPGATDTVVIIDNGLQFGTHNSLDDFQGQLSAPPKAGVNVVFVDLATAVDDGVVANEGAAVDAIIATNPALIATYFGDHSAQTAAALSSRHQFAIGASYSLEGGIDSVLGFYDDFKLAQAGGTATVYGGIPAVRYGLPTAAHQIVVFPYGTDGEDFQSDFATLAGLPADVAVTMIGLAQTNDLNVRYQEWIIDAVLAQHPDVVAAPDDMQVFNSGSGSSSQDIGDYVADNSQPPTTFAQLHSGQGLAAEIADIYAGKGWG